MARVIFAGPAHIEIQGPQVLTLIGIESEKAEYQVVGFKETVRIIDRRVKGLAAIRSIKQPGGLDRFAIQFNAPARITVVKKSSKDITIELDETRSVSPKHILWIAIGIQDAIPVYHYVFDCLAALDDKRFAFLALFRGVPESNNALEMVALAPS